MSKLEQLDREQLKHLDQVSLIGVILILQQQMTEQQALIQQMQDQLAKDSHNNGKQPTESEDGDDLYRCHVLISSVEGKEESCHEADK